MKSIFSLLLLLLFTGKICISQTVSLDKILIDETLILKTDYLKTKPFYKKGLFFLFRSSQYKQCEINLAVRLGVTEKSHFITYSIDNIKGNTKPITKTIKKEDYTKNSLQQFLDSCISVFINKPICDRCVYSFTNYY